MNLLQLIQECERRSGFNDQNFRYIWSDFLNAGIREFSRSHPWPGLEDIITLNSDGTDYLVLPHFVDTIVQLHNITDGTPVIALDNFSREWPGTYAVRSPGSVQQYYKLGEVAALREPANYVWFQSTSASDIDTIYVTGQVNNSGASGGALATTLKTVSATAAGTSPVTLSVNFASILTISRTTEGNGDFFFYDSGASNQHISFLSQYETQARFRRLQLFSLPAASTAFELKFRYKIPPIRNYYQAPPPGVRDDFLISFALERFYQHQDNMQKSQLQHASTMAILQGEANKEENFNEPDSRIYPLILDELED